MRSNARVTSGVEGLLEHLTATGDKAPALDDLVALTGAVRQVSPAASVQVDRHLLQQIVAQREALAEVRKRHKRLEEIVGQLTTPPLHPALLLEQTDTPEGRLALVLHGNARRVVTLDVNIDPSQLAPGDEVLLGPEQNVIVRCSPYRTTPDGNTAAFERYLEDGRLALRSRDEQVLVRAAGPLQNVALEPGDVVRWSPAAGLAFEHVPRSTSHSAFLEETPTQSFEDIGGLDRMIDTLRETVEMHLFHPELVKRYALPRKGSILLVGPPGCGKTLVARALAAHLASLSGGQARFMNVKPGALHSMWYGQAEANYRELFRVAREAAAQDPGVPVVVFFDELDAIGGTRGGGHAHVDDKIQNAFFVELDGLATRGNVLVIGATNRREALDPALLRPGRFGDDPIEIPRPGRSAARDILAKHLPEGIPYAVNGHGDAAAARAAILDTAVSRLFAPNGEGELARITFRDGKQRGVAPRDLISGATLANLTRRARERACRREIEDGPAGLCESDITAAITVELAQAVGSLTPASCRHHLSGLPDDVDVVRLERVGAPLASRAVRYLNAV